MSEDDIRDLFREMRDEAVPLDSLVRVQVRIEERARRRAPWKIAAWVAACAALLIAAFVVQIRPAWRKSPASAPVAEQHQAGSPPPVVATPPEDEPVSVRPAIERKVHKPRPAPTTQTVSIRIETPDPNVVILLVGDDVNERNKR